MSKLGIPLLRDQLLHNKLVSLWLLIITIRITVRVCTDRIPQNIIDYISDTVGLQFKLTSTILFRWSLSRHLLFVLALGDNPCLE